MPDGKPDYIPEDLSINDQESFVELVLEKCVGIDDAFAEQDETDNEGPDFDMSKEFKANTQSATKIIYYRLAIGYDSSVPYKHTYISQYVNEITHPPPQA